MHPTWARAQGSFILSGFRAWGALIGLVTAAALVGACGDRGERPGDGNREATSGVGSSQADDIPEVEVPALWAVGEARDIQTLTSSAEVVFRGRVLAFKGQQSAKSPAGSEAAGARPRWADLPVSRFEVSVENVMSGQLPTTTVVLEQIGGVETRPDGTQARIRLEDDPPVRVGTTYLIFGKLQPDGSVAAPPFGRLQVRGDGSLAAEAGWEDLGALRELSKRKLGDAEREVSANRHD